MLLILFLCKSIICLLIRKCLQISRLPAKEEAKRQLKLTIKTVFTNYKLGNCFELLLQIVLPGSKRTTNVTDSVFYANQLFGFWFGNVSKFLDCQTNKKHLILVITVYICMITLIKWLHDVQKEHCIAKLQN